MTEGVFVPLSILTHPQLTGSDKIIWAAFKLVTEGKPKTVPLRWVSEVLGLTREQIGNKVPILENAGVLKVERNTEGKRRTPSTYTVVG